MISPDTPGLEGLLPNFDHGREQYRQLSEEDKVAQLVARDALIKVLLQRGEAAERDSLHDDLTGLCNRRGLRYEYEQRQGAAFSRRRNTDKPDKADLVFYLDLDGFKAVNDAMGHGAGDETLKRIADLLRITLRTDDKAGRIGGDEFVGMLWDANLQEGQKVLERYYSNAKLFSTADESVTLPGASIGLMEIDYELEFEQLIGRVDGAMYAAKHAGKNQLYILGSDSTYPEA